MITKQTQILIVDDDIDTLSLLSLTLKRANYDVTKASSGATAISLTKTNQYDLILLDLMMPDYSGFDVLRAIRVSQKSMPIVVLLTAKTSMEDQITARELGASGYLTKPISRNDLLKRLDDLFSKKQA